MINPPRHPRELAFNLSLPPEAGPIHELIPRQGHLEVIARNAIYAMVTADQMDPARKSANLPNSLKKLASIGSASPIVARVYLQPRQLMANWPLKRSSSEAIIEQFHSCKDAIQQADEIAGDLLGEYDAIIKAASGPGFMIRGGALHAPHIEKLDLRLGGFFRHAKIAVQSVGEAFNLFYGLATKADGPVKNGNFDYARNYLSRQQTPSQSYIAFLNQSKNLTARIVRARNGFDHPGPDTMQITNFEIRDGNLVAPLWNFPSEKATGVFLDLPVIVSSLVQFAEGNFIHAFADNLNAGMPLQLVPIPRARLTPSAPSVSGSKSPDNRLHWRRCRRVSATH
jgi:hypothetical protein